MKLILTAFAAFSVCGHLYADVSFDSLGTSFSRDMQAISVPAPTPVEVIFYAKKDGTRVFSAPERTGGDSDILAELRGGERVKVIGRTGDLYNVAINRREYNSEAGQWTNTQGWVSVASIGEDAPATESLTIPMTFQDMQPGGCREAFIEKLKGFAAERVPYVWGGTSHSGVDCSGLVVAAMLESGCIAQTPPRTAADQQRAAAPRESVDQLQPGDLIFVGTPAHHVIVFMGKEQDGSYTVIEAPNKGSVVNIHPLQLSANETFGALLQ
ncbi:MAG: NlpC/P60 family protein [Elusimicrobia bacterium]|nr:NlpC/P60 family protein [Elusimicrobiota bacterium]